MRATVCIVASAIALTGCSSTSPFKPLRDPVKLTIGVPVDLPGVGMKTDKGLHTGFDVEVARYIAARLGAAPDGITFKGVEDRAAAAKMIADGAVDFVVANVPMTTDNKNLGFAGPYFVAGETFLVRTDNYDIVVPDALDNKQVCAVKGTTTAQDVIKRFDEPATTVEANSLQDCVLALRKGEVDAVVGDNLILAGFAAEAPTEVKVVSQPFTETPYGVALKKDDKALRTRINAAIGKMISDGSYNRIFDITLGNSGVPTPKAPIVAPN